MQRCCVQSRRRRGRAEAHQGRPSQPRVAMASAATEPVTSDYVRVRRKKTTIFLWADMSDTAADLKAKIHKITKVPAVDMKLFIDKNGEIVLDENKALADQKARLLLANPDVGALPRIPTSNPSRARAQVENDQELFMVYRKEGARAQRPTLRRRMLTDSTAVAGRTTGAATPADDMCPFRAGGDGEWEEIEIGVEAKGGEAAS